MTAAQLTGMLGLVPHPEGGWYRETVRRPSVNDIRDAMTAIFFLLDGGARSVWHRVDADELWLWRSGSPLNLRIVENERQSNHLLSGDVLSGHVPQLMVPAGAWQSAEAPAGWALVSCVVVPGFDFSGFELAPGDVLPPCYQA